MIFKGKIAEKDGLKITEIIAAWHLTTINPQFNSTRNLPVFFIYK